jgi:ribosome biogenesis GTPase YqeH
LGQQSSCRGCGIPFQTVDPAAPGYVLPEVFERKNILCQRCYRLLHYGKGGETPVEGEQIVKNIRRGIKEAGLVVQVFDIIDFEGSQSEVLKGLIGSKPILAAVNKVDLLPKQVKIQEAMEWLKFRIADLGISTVGIHLVSSTRERGISGLLKEIRRLSNRNHRVALVGVTNVGKSSLLNAMRRRAGGRNINTGRELTVSPYPGTTQGLISVDLTTAGILIIDTPGIVQGGRLGDLLCPECGKKLIPVGELSRKTFKLGQGQSLLFGGLAELAIKGGAELPILVAFAAKGVPFHTTASKRVAGLWKRHSGHWLVPPCGLCRQNLRKWEKSTVLVHEGKDLVIPGLGWVSVRRGPVRLEISLPGGVNFVTRPALITPVRR